MKTIVKRLILMAIALAGIGSAGRAQAATPGVQYVLILLDQTGSMATVSNSGAGTTFWDDAVSGAQAWVSFDSGATPLPRRAYSVWTFYDTKCAGCGTTNQDGALQVWPALTNNGQSTSSTDCGPSTGSTFEATTGFCVFNSGDSTGYGALAARLGDFGNTDQTSLRNAFRAATGVGNTPLADSLCQTMEQLQLSVSAQNRILLLETDAGENDSVNPCAAPNGFTNIPAGATSFNKQDVDWDLTGAAPGVTPDPVNNPSWEAKVMRRAVRLAGTGTTPITTPPDVSSEAAAEAKGPIEPGEDLPPLMGLRVDLHFMICNGGDPPPCPVTTAFGPRMPGINLPGLGVVAVGPMEGKGGSPTLATPKFAVTQAMTAPVTTTGQTTIAAPGVPLIDTNEFLFFQALGHVNSKSTFRAITSDSSVHFGKSHRLTGDVDDSGCVDHADFAEVTQKDIYHQRAVLPLELATRADLNHDGWVTKADAAIVIANWGHGCINGAGTPPALPKF